MVIHHDNCQRLTSTAIRWCNEYLLNRSLSVPALLAFQERQRLHNPLAAAEHIQGRAITSVDWSDRSLHKSRPWRNGAHRCRPPPESPQPGRFRHRPGCYRWAPMCPMRAALHSLKGTSDHPADYRGVGRAERGKRKEGGEGERGEKGGERERGREGN